MLYQTVRSYKYDEWGRHPPPPPAPSLNFVCAVLEDGRAMKYRKLAHTLWVSSESANAAGCKPVFFGSSWGGTNLAHQKVNSSTRLAQLNSDSLPAARQHPTVDDKGSRELICSVGQVVKTQDFHSCITSSTLVPSAIGSANSISTIREQCTRLPLTNWKCSGIMC